MFENIKVDVTKGYHGKIFHLHVRGGNEASYTENCGYAIEDVTFRNVFVRYPTKDLYPSVMICRDKAADEADTPHIFGIRFENVFFGQEKIQKNDLRIIGNVGIEII